MDFSTILLNTQNPDATTRKLAEEQLQNALQSNMAQFMVTLTQALGTENYPIVGRQAAGLYLKNVLDAKDMQLQKQKTAAWLALDANARQHVKSGAIQVLQSHDQTARHTAAQLVAKIGAIELPEGQWPNLLQELLQNVTSGHEGAQQATLESLGYMCDYLQDTDAELEQDDTNKILTAIVDGIRSDRASPIRLAAVTALNNSLEFISENFARAQERNHIMQVVCEATQCSDLKVRVAAFQCIGNVATMYYEYLDPYMQALYNLTFDAVRNNQAEVGMQALEFWSSVCDAEIELIEEAEFDMGNSGTNESTCKYYIKGVLRELVGLLTETLRHQEEDQDEDTWNISMAGGTCLGLVAQTVRDECVDPTMSFITVNIAADNWRAKEAALMAFGSILDGPSTEKVGPLVSQAMPLLLNCMTDANVLVRDTTAWSIGRICELHPTSIGQEMFQPLMELFIHGLTEEPRVANNICFAIHNLTRQFEHMRDHPTSLLSRYFGGLFDKLLETTERSDWMENSLRDVAYEAAGALISVGAIDTKQHVVLRLPAILMRLEQAFANQSGNTQERETHTGLQVSLCSVVLVIIQRLEAEIIPYADRIMRNLLNVFNSGNSTADEEAFMAVGALANAVNGDFERYMSYFSPILLKGIGDSESYMVCSVAVGVVGDLCRALEEKMLPYCNDILQALLTCLQNPNCNRSVKPPVLSCFGDIALSIGPSFEAYLDPVMMMLEQASHICRTITDDDEDNVDYMNQLRENIVEAYTGIIQGLSAGDKASLIMKFLPSLQSFISCLAADVDTRNEAVTCGCAGLIGDLAHTLGKQVAPFVRHEYVHQLLKECLDSSTPASKNVGQWAQGIIAPLQN